MYIEDIGTRLTELRMKKGVSEYRLSLELGQSKTYIGMITSGKSLPSMRAFEAICEYFEITPAEFFCRSLDSAKQELIEEANRLDDEDIQTLTRIAKGLAAIKSERKDSKEE